MRPTTRGSPSIGPIESQLIRPDAARKPMCGKHLGERGPARVSVNPLVVTTYAILFFFLVFLKNFLDMVDKYSRMVYYDS